MGFELEYGHGSLPIPVAARRVRAEVAPRPTRGLTDVPAAVRKSLASPHASPPLREVLEGKRTALILTVDHTRPSPTPLLEPILDVCAELGVEPTVCVATGRHRAMTDPEIERHFSPSIRSRARIVQHDAFDDDAMRDLGVTTRGTPVRVNRIVFEHDVVLGAGILEPSYLCGFSGGRKLIMPGVAHHTAVDANHFLLTQPGAVIGRLHGNPVSDDATEFARRVPFHFVTYAIAGPHDEAVQVISGDPFAAHEEACTQTRSLYEVSAPGAPLVIASPGGYPYDCDLVQAKKAVIPATKLVTNGGAIVLLGECAEGLGAEETFLQWLKTMTPREVAERVRQRERFSLGAHGANILARPIVERAARVILVTRPEVCEALAGTYVEAVPTIEEALTLAEADAGREADVVVLRNARRLIVS